MIRSTSYDFLGLGVLFLFLCVHPFLTYPLSLMVLNQLSPRREHANAAIGKPSISFSLCAYNEGAVIAETVTRLLEIRRRYGDLQILIYVDGATDGTAEQLAPFSPQVTTVVSPDRNGNNYGLRRLVSIASSPISCLPTQIRKSISTHLLTGCLLFLRLRSWLREWCSGLHRSQAIRYEPR